MPVPEKSSKDKKGKSKERGRDSSSRSTPQDSRGSSMSASFDEPARARQYEPPTPVIKNYAPPMPSEVPPEIYVDMVSEPPPAQPERFQSAAAAVVASSSLAEAYQGLAPSSNSPSGSGSPAGSASGLGAGPSHTASEAAAAKIVSEEILRQATEELIRQYPEMAKHGAESVRREYRDSDVILLASS